jgi:ribosomal protein S18 acetylase RimI-like enzyme
MKKSPLVRKAEPFDVEEISEIAKRPSAARWSRKAYATEIERADSIFLVADDGTVSGYAVARLFEDTVELLDFAAAADGRGTGRALWAALAAAARGRGAAKLTLEVSSANSRALLFYKRAGARVAGRRAKFYNDGSDAILMDFILP